MIDISIIVPIYNSEKYLKKCIDSLISQTKENIEIILINDGSEDNSDSIIKSYNDKRIKYFKNKNQGIGKTRNFGIEKASGKYLMFIDSDDYIEKSTCEVLFKKAKKENLDLVICNYYKIKNNTKEEVIITPFENCSLKENPLLLLEINLSPWNKLYKTDLIKKNNLKFVENLKYEDAPFVTESLDKSKKIGYIAECLNYYVIHNNSETTIRDHRVFDILKIVDIIRNYFGKKDYMKESLDKLIVRIITNYNIQQRNQKDIRLGMRFIDDSFEYLKTYVPNYKNNKYYQGRSTLQRTIEKNKLLTKLYCRIYHLKKYVEVKYEK